MGRRAIEAASRRFLKPWFIHNPRLALRAALYDLGVSARGWTHVTTCFGATMLCDTNKAIGRALYKNGVYELATSELMWRLLKDSSDAVFVDVGANIGYYSALARKRLGTNGSVMCFEPSQDLFKCLQQNLQGLAVETYPVACSKTEGIATLHVPRNALQNDGLATLEECTEALSSYAVKTVALDQFISREILVLKVDVEGHEYDVLLGAIQALSSGKIRNIVFEEHDIDSSEVVKLLQRYSYDVLSVGWNRSGLTVRPLGTANSSYVTDAPNYIATLDAAKTIELTREPGWTLLRSK